jgi:hypothetical protein
MYVGIGILVLGFFLLHRLGVLLLGQCPANNDKSPIAASAPKIPGCGRVSPEDGIVKESLRYTHSNNKDLLFAGGGDDEFIEKQFDKC